MAKYSDRDPDNTDFPTTVIQDTATVSVRKTHGLSLLLPVSIEGLKTQAVVDTAAMVTMISSTFFERLGIANGPVEEVTLRGVADIPVRAHRYSGIKLALGRTSYPTDVFVAPMKDPVLLGLDFLSRHGCHVNLQQNTVTLYGEELQATLKRSISGDDIHISRVSLPESQTFPADSVTFVKVKLQQLPPQHMDLVIDPSRKDHGLMVSSALINSESPVLKVINSSSRPIRLRRGHTFGSASEFLDILESEEDEELQVRSSSAMPQGDLNAKLEEIKEEMPEHLKNLFCRSCVNKAMSEQCQIGQLLLEFQERFAKDDTDIGCMKGVKHSINTGNANPIKQKMRRTPLHFQDQEKSHLEKLLSLGIIRPSSSEWAAAPVLVRKKDGSLRYCLDFRALNSVTVKDSFPLPLIEDCLDTLEGSEYFSCLDLACGYYQVELDAESISKSAFITKFGLFEHTRMPFGLCNAPATFQRAMELVLRGMTWKEVLVYIDDIIVLGKSFGDALLNLRRVLERMREFDLKLKPSKCKLFQTEVEFLGKVVDRNGVSVAPAKIEAVKAWPIPTDKSQLLAFLGFINYHREHLSHLADESATLYHLVRKDVTWEWTEKHQRSFDNLRQLLISAPCLAYPTREGKFILDVDASNFAIGAELSQVQEGKIVVIAYASAVLSPAQRKYCTTRKELLAIVRFTRYFRHYLLGRPFLVRTDHHSLVWLMRFRHLEGQLARWLEELQQFDMEILHRSGTKHGNADSLSRIPSGFPECNCYQAGCRLEELPCKGCGYCSRVHHAWSRFEVDVDDVIPLAVRTLPRMETPILQVRTHGSEDDAKLDQTILDQVAFVPNEEEERPSNWMEGFDRKSLRCAQLKDKDLAPVISWLESGTEPDQATLFLASPATKSLWLSRPQLSLEKGILFYIRDEVISKRLCLVVPTLLRDHVLHYCHDVKTAGHLGVIKTQERVRQHFFWRSMRDDVYLYVQSCAVCNQNKKPSPKHPRASLGRYHAGFPMERIHLDILGPFNESSQGNVYILMMIDQFTKWLELAALPKQDAESCAYQFLVHFVTTFGCPLEVHTDQGRNFDSNLFKAMCSVLEISKTRTTPYHPCSNGQIERYNQVVVQMVRCFLEGQNREWDKHLPFLAMALHATVQRQTGFTPNMLMLGREVLQPVDLMLGLTEFRAEHSPEGWIQKITAAMTDSHHLAREHLRTSQKKQKKDYDLRSHEKGYCTGDIVYLRDTSHIVGVSTKLKKPYKGPYLVTKAEHPLYTIQDQKRASTVHHDRLKVCNDRDIPIWLRRKRHLILNPGIPPVKDAVQADECLIDGCDPGESHIDPDISYLFQDTESDGEVNSSPETITPPPDITPRFSSRGRALRPNSKYQGFTH